MLWDVWEEFYIMAPDVATSYLRWESSADGLLPTVTPEGVVHLLVWGLGTGRMDVEESLEIWEEAGGSANAWAHLVGIPAMKDPAWNQQQRPQEKDQGSPTILIDWRTLWESSN